MLRPGRIDRQWVIARPKTRTVIDYAGRFYPDGDGTAALAERAISEGWSMADVQHHLMADLSRRDL